MYARIKYTNKNFNFSSRNSGKQNNKVFVTISNESFSYKKYESSNHTASLVPRRWKNWINPPKQYNLKWFVVRFLQFMLHSSLQSALKTKLTMWPLSNLEVTVSTNESKTRLVYKNKIFWVTLQNNLFQNWTVSVKRFIICQDTSDHTGLMRDRFAWPTEWILCP